ncbi:MAG: OmpA family protein, partial [Oscillospiraceae bacterium]
NLFFDGDSSVLQPKSKAILDVLSRAISSIPEKIAEIQAHGHTAQEHKDVENSVAFDRTLSGNRASNVVAYLQVKSREISPKKYITPNKLTSQGHGQYMPLAPHDGTEVTRKKNRRVELLISEVNGSTMPSLQDVYDELSGKKPIATKEEKAEIDKKLNEDNKAAEKELKEETTSKTDDKKETEKVSSKTTDKK